MLIYGGTGSSADGEQSMSGRHELPVLDSREPVKHGFWASLWLLRKSSLKAKLAILVFIATTTVIKLQLSHPNLLFWAALAVLLWELMLGAYLKTKGIRSPPKRPT